MGTEAAEKEAGPVCRPTMSEWLFAIAAAESKKAAAEENARLVCRPKLSEPACMPPEAAVSVDNLLAMWHALNRAHDALALFDDRAIADKKAAAEKDARLVRKPHMSEPFSAFAAAESKKAAAEMEVVANKNRWCFAGTCHCAGIIAGCISCSHGGGIQCINPRSPLQRYSRKPLCDGCTNCGVIILCIACPESKEAAAEKDARLVCGPKMSEPAWYFGGRPEAAASVNNLLDIRDNAVA